MNKEEVLVLFSGGTDSTLTAALMAEKFSKVHLVTYERFGFFSIKNSEFNVKKLRQKFGEDRFTHQIIRIDNLSKYIFYERYLRNFIKYRFFLLSTCGLCKLAMHIRSILFCLDNKISNVCDGANKGMYMFPAQMKSVVGEIISMYKEFGINYDTPVFELENPEGLEFTDRLNLEKVLPALKDTEKDSGKIRQTAGHKLFELGLMPLENVKGTKIDKKMQARCFQLILFNIFVFWYYMHGRTYEQYEQATLRFFKDKIRFFSGLIREYRKKKEKAKLGKIIREK